jgi:ribosomal protein S18 acetylase RimI-like enzyme
VLVREKVRTDTDGCAALMCLTHHLDGYPRYLPEDLVAFLNSGAELAGWVVESGGEIVGHVALHDAAGDPTFPAAQAATGLPPERLAVVARLMVHPKHRRRGIAQHLLQVTRTYAEQDERRLVLDVLQSSAPAIHLYENLGWQRVAPLTLPIRAHPPLQLWVYVSPADSKGSALPPPPAELGTERH